MFEEYAIAIFESIKLAEMKGMKEETTIRQERLKTRVRTWKVKFVSGIVGIENM